MCHSLTSVHCSGRVELLRMSDFTFIVGGEGVLSFDIVSGPVECFAASQSFQLVKYVDALVVMTT